MAVRVRMMEAIIRNVVRQKNHGTMTWAGRDMHRCVYVCGWRWRDLGSGTGGGSSRSTYVNGGAEAASARWMSTTSNTLYQENKKNHVLFVSGPIIRSSGMCERISMNTASQSIINTYRPRNWNWKTRSFASASASASAAQTTENPYKILGVDSKAKGDDIQKAYRKLALQYHPDRHTNESCE